MIKKRVAVNAERDVIIARQAGREVMRELGFGSADQTRLATAISELTRNTIQYATRGSCIISDVSNNKCHIVQVAVEDHGPGISDIDKALEYGFSTGKGLGAGLPGTRNLVSMFEIKSKPGHTKIILGMTRMRV